MSGQNKTLEAKGKKKRRRNIGPVPHPVGLYVANNYF